MHIHVDDLVEIIAGADRSTKVEQRRGKVLKVLHEQRRVVVEGVARVYKHVKRSQQNPQGGRLSKEMPIAVSNVMLVDPTTDQPTRVGVRILEDGSKERYSKSSGAAMGLIAPAKKSK